MSNRILDVKVATHRLDPHEAEVWVMVKTESVSSTTEIRGRIVGPKSAKQTTIEIAYRLRPFPQIPSDLAELSVRAVIPEPSIWKPESPFVYEVFVELWEDNRFCDQRKVEGYVLAGSRPSQ